MCHLYNAYEDVWITNVTANHEPPTTNHGFRVTQRFYDALGRETNTVVYAGVTPGEATVASASDGKACTTVSTVYPYGGSDYAVSTVLDGVTRRDDTTYETDSSNIVWRVESSSVVGPSTNSLIITRTQLTGLSGSCRRHTVTLVGIPQAAGESRSDALAGVRVVPNAPQTVTETVATFDPDTSIETETTTSSVAPSIVRLLLHGLVLTSETSGVTTVNAYDAFGRIAATSRSVGSAAFLPLQSFDYAPCGDLVLVVRSRCKLNEDGTLKSAHYFQLGEIRFSGDERGAALKFLSIFNPTPNDTNLEPKWSGGAT